MVGFHREPEVSIQRECAGVRLLSVHQHHRAATAFQPPERVEHECRGETSANVIGMHRQALEVPDFVGATADRVAEDSVLVEDTESRCGGRVESLVETLRAEMPEVVEGEVVEAEDGRPVVSAGTTQTVIGARQIASEVVLEDVQPLVERESRVLEHVGLRSSQGRGERSLEAALVEIRHALLDGVDVRHGVGRRVHPHVRRRLVVVPRSDDEPVLADDEGLASHRWLWSIVGCWEMLVLITEPGFAEHRPGPHHPESPARLAAVIDASRRSEFADAITTVAPKPASQADLARVHSAEMLSVLRDVDGTTAQIDADTAVSPRSVELATLAAGAGLTAVDQLRSGVGDAAFCAVRPPGHHATAAQSMGFCLLNNIAVTAAALVAQGERVLIADFDAHHGNGTQDIFYDDPSVLFVSWHQSPLYPGTGRLVDIGGPLAVGRTVNVPLRPGTTGDLYLESVDRVLGGIIDRFAPTWLLISAGFDAHRHDPLTDLGLTSGDFNDLTRVLMEAVPARRTIAFLEGGYDLEALGNSAAACMAGLLGERLHPEIPSSGEVGGGIIEAVEAVHGLR